MITVDRAELLAITAESLWQEDIFLAAAKSKFLHDYVNQAFKNFGQLYIEVKVRK